MCIFILFLKLFIHSLIQQYLMSTYCVLNTIEAGEHRAANQRNKSPCLHGAYILVNS